MDWFTHYMFGFVLGRKLRFERYEMMALLLGSLLSDVDFIVGLFGIGYFRDYHRVFTHSLLIAPLLGLVLALVLYLVLRRNLVVPTLLGIFNHLLLDAFNLPKSSLEYLFPNASFNRAEYDMGTAYFWPLSRDRFSLHEGLELPDPVTLFLFFSLIAASIIAFLYYMCRGVKPWYPFLRKDTTCVNVNDNESIGHDSSPATTKGDDDEP